MELASPRARTQRSEYVLVLPDISRISASNTRLGRGARAAAGSIPVPSVSCRRGQRRATSPARSRSFRYSQHDSDGIAEKGMHARPVLENVHDWLTMSGYARDGRPDEQNYKNDGGISRITNTDGIRGGRVDSKGRPVPRTVSKIAGSRDTSVPLLMF